MTDCVFKSLAEVIQSNPRETEYTLEKLSISEKEEDFPTFSKAEDTKRGAETKMDQVK